MLHFRTTNCMEHFLNSSTYLHKFTLGLFVLKWYIISYEDRNSSLHNSSHKIFKSEDAKNCESHFVYFQNAIYCQYVVFTVYQ